MLKSALITAATALAITAGAFGVSSASADTRQGGLQVEVTHRDGHGYREGHGYRDGYGYRGWKGHRGYGERHVRGPARVCKPILRTVKVRGHHGWHFKRVVVAERCHFVRRGW